MVWNEIGDIQLHQYINGVHIVFLSDILELRWSSLCGMILLSSIFIIRRRSSHHRSQTCADTNNKGKKKLRTCHCLKRLRSGCYINECITHTIHRYTVTFPQSHCNLRDRIPTMKVGYDVGFGIKRLFKFKWDLSIYYIAFDWKTLLV